MNVCGVLVHVMPSRCEVVINELRTLDGVEVHDTTEGSRIVVTVEDTKNAAAIDTLTAVHKVDGVVAATLVYHQFEPELNDVNDTSSAG